MSGTQCLLHGFVEQTLGLEPATGTQVQLRRRFRRLTAAQQVGEQVVIAEPAAVLVQRYQEYLVRLQVTEDGGAVMAVAQGVAQGRAETLLTGGVVKKGLHIGGQDLDDLFQQVVADQALAAMQRLGQGMLVARLAGGQLPEAQPRHPAVAALDQVVQGLATQAGRLPANHRQGLFGRQAQVLLVELGQLPRQAQPRQVPIRALAAGDQQHQAGGQMIEEELQATVEHRALGQVVVVQHQQQRAVGLQVKGQLVEQAVEPFFEGERLVALAHLQQAHGLTAQGRAELLEAFEQAFEEAARVGIALAEAEPEAAPMAWQSLAKLDHQ
ncbi:hypothetical protein D3C79_662520 [compost metagenome]